MSQGSYPGYGPANPGGQYNAPAPQKSGGSGSAVKIILIILGVMFALALVVCGILAALLIPAVGAARDAAKRMQDQNNMKMVALAMHNYESTYRRLPAPYAVDAEGKPVWSWAVSVLPFVEESATFAKVDFQDMKPWDDPKNSVFQGSAPATLRSIRADEAPDSNMGHVFIISAPYRQGAQNPAFSDGRYGKFADIVDGTSNTLMAIMLVKHSAPWAKPSALTPDEAYSLIQKEDKVFLGAMMDGSVYAFKTDMDRASFDALVSRDGGEVIDIDSLMK